MTEEFAKIFLEIGVVMSTSRGSLLVGWGRRSWMSQPADTEKHSFFFPDFFLQNTQPWFQQEHVEEMTVEELLESLGPDHAQYTPLLWHNPYEQLFTQTFDDLQDRFLRGNLSKAVPFVFEKTSHYMTEDMLRHALQNLLFHAKSQPLHVYGFWEKGQGILGATPEMLFAIPEQEYPILQTVAVAGTQSHEGSQGALLEDPKELREHQIVVDGITDSLSRLGKVRRGETHVLQLKRLSHLATKIEVQLAEPTSYESIVQALHPTPALGAFPREEGTSWLKDYQTKLERNRFGAPVGYRGKDSSCYVAIRNVQWFDHEMLIGGGCGIIQASQRDREWQEINLKICATKEMLGL